MIRNYIKIAFRILKRNKIYVALNLLGLGFAIACCIMAYLNYSYRYSFDNNHSNTQHVHRVNSIKIVNKNNQNWGVVPLPVAEAIHAADDKNQQTARLASSGAVISYKGNSFNEQLHFADKSLFDLFSFPIKYGNLNSFNAADAIVLSEQTADKYFPNTTPVGKTITVILSDSIVKEFIIAAVLQKIPDNSSIQFDLVTSFSNLYTAGIARQSNWGALKMVSTFVALNENYDVKQFQKNLVQYVGVHNRNHNNWNVSGFYLQQFNDIAFSSDVDMPNYVHGSQLAANPRGVLVILPAIMSFLILLITCFNFTNISIAFASNRLKEIGIRKVMGGVRTQLIYQFLTENIILCLLSSVLAILFVVTLLPSFNQLTGLSLLFDFNNGSGLFFFLCLMPLVTAFFSGIYPSFYISSFKPISILKGKTTFGSTNRFTRVLLIAQFSLSCFAMVVGIILIQNTSYQKNVDFGYAINELAVVELKTAKDYTLLSNEIRSNPAINGIAGTKHQIGDNSYSAVAKTNNNEVQAQVLHIGGEEYLKTMGVQLLQGRHFYNNKSDEDVSVMVNQTFVKQLNIQEPIGARVNIDSINYTITGVVNDFKEFGLHGLVPPCVLRLANAEHYSFLVIRADEKKLPALSKYIQTVWQKINPNYAFNMFLQTELIEKEVRLNAGFKAIAFFLAIVILLLSLSGLFALISLNIDRRSKEIGIRKVLGASLLQILAAINREIIRIVLISFVVGSALGFLFTNKFIFQVIYKYHPDSDPYAYMITLAVITFSLAAIIGYKVYKAANANPMYSLRTE